MLGCLRKLFEWSIWETISPSSAFTALGEQFFQRRKRTIWPPIIMMWEKYFPCLINIFQRESFVVGKFDKHQKNLNLFSFAVEILINGQFLFIYYCNSPQAIFRDPFRRGNNILVMCDAYTPQGEPIPTNKRHNAEKIFSQPDVVAEEPWWAYMFPAELMQ